MVRIFLHGDLGRQMKRNEWNLDVRSVSEGIHAINSISKNRLYKYFYEKNKGQAQYQILINKREFYTEKPLTETNLEDIANSELVMNLRNLKSIDIVPVISGARDIISIVLGVVLIAVGVIFSSVLGPLSAALIIGGIGLIAAGVINLLSKPPKFEDFREIDGQTGRNSYLFNGPQNTTKEGGNVPVGYGQLVVGSQVISASYVIDYINADQIAPAKVGTAGVNSLQQTNYTVQHTGYFGGFGDDELAVYKDVSSTPIKFYVFIKYFDRDPARQGSSNFGTQYFRSYSTITDAIEPHVSPCLSPLFRDQTPLLPFDPKKTVSRIFLSPYIYCTKEYDSTDTDLNKKGRFVIIREDFRGGNYSVDFYLVPNSLNLMTPGLFDPGEIYSPIWQVR